MKQLEILCGQKYDNLGKMEAATKSCTTPPDGCFPEKMCEIEILYLQNFCFSEISPVLLVFFLLKILFIQKSCDYQNRKKFIDLILDGIS